MTRPATAAISIALGAVGGCLYLALAFGSPGALILVYLTELPLFIAGLWLGTGGAALAGASGTVLLLLASDLVGALLFVGLDALPVTVLVRQALLARSRPDGRLAWYPPGLLIAWLAGYALAGIAVAVLLVGGPHGLERALHGIVEEALQRASRRPIPNSKAVADALVAILPGVVAASWIVTTIGNALLAQALLVRFNANWRPTPDIVAVVLPMWLPAAFAVAAALTIVAGAPRFVGVNLIIALSVPFTLAGLAVAHAAVRRLSSGSMILLFGYMLAVMFGWPFVLVAVLGLFEPWLGLRRRFASEEGEFDG